MVRASLGRFVLVLLCVATLGSPARASTSGPPTLSLGGMHCDLISVPMNEPLAGTSSCLGVRPGALVETPKGFCTLNFLFLGSDGARYIGTAGHCVLGDSEFEIDAGEKSWKYGKGPYAKDSTGKIFGYFVYSILQSPKDFALIRIARGITSSPSMCVFGGPTGINTSRTGPTVLHHFGNGTGIGDVLPGRTEIAQDMSSLDHVFANGLITPGDSGSGAIDDSGKAVGVIVTLGAHTGDATSDAGIIGITRLSPQIARANKVMKLHFKLLTAAGA